jgi:hypothetical protein
MNDFASEYGYESPPEFRLASPCAAPKDMVRNIEAAYLRNPNVLNNKGLRIRSRRSSQGKAIALSGYTRIHHIWDDDTVEVE